MDDAAQRCLEFALSTEPATAPRDYADFYGNTVHYFEIVPAHPALAVEAWSAVETIPLADRPIPPLVTAAELERADERALQAEFAASSPLVELDDAFAREAGLALGNVRHDVWSDVRRLGSYVFRTFAYRPNSTAVNTPARDALALRRGVCQDFAHVHLGLCRSLGMPARYVSGYFFNPTRKPDEAEASHAWIEVWLPGYGWAAYDPTHDRMADDRYVKVAVGRDYADICPVKGTYRGGTTRGLEVNVTVRAVESALPA